MNSLTKVVGFNTCFDPKQVPDSDTDWWVSDQEEELIRLLSDSKENITNETLQSDIIPCLLIT